MQSDAVIAVERFISFGIVPPEALQHLLYRPGRIGLLKIAMAAACASASRCH